MIHQRLVVRVSDSRFDRFNGAYRASSRYNSMTRMDGLFLCWIFADPRILDLVCFWMFPLLCRFSKCRIYDDE